MIRLNFNIYALTEPRTTEEYLAVLQEVTAMLEDLGEYLAWVQDKINDRYLE